MNNNILAIVIFLSFSVLTWSQDIAIKKGWQMKGSDSGFLNTEPFNKQCINSVWSYDINSKTWKVYSKNITIINAIRDRNDITLLKSINNNDGFWINANSDCVISDSNSSVQPKQSLYNKTLQLIYKYDYSGADYHSFSISLTDKQDNTISTKSNTYPEFVCRDNISGDFPETTINGTVNHWDYVCIGKEQLYSTYKMAFALRFTEDGVVGIFEHNTNANDALLNLFVNYDGFIAGTLSDYKISLTRILNRYIGSK